MKLPVKLLAIVAGGCFLSSTLRAQHQHHAMSAHKTAVGVRLEVRNDKATETLMVRLGPLDLPAHIGHHALAQAPEFFLTIPFDGWLVAYHPRLVDEAGDPLPKKLLHHVAFWNTGRPDFLCRRKQEHIFGAGGEMNDWPALPGFGYRVAKGDRIRISTMFHNPTDRSFPNLYFEVRTEYRLSSADRPQLKNVYPVWFDVQQCGDSGYDLHPGVNVNQGGFQFPYTGTLLGVGGHLHDFGLRLLLENATRKEKIAELDSTLDPQGHILSMPVVNFVSRGGYRLNEGEAVRVTATYDNPTGEALPEGAMGIVVGYFLPDNDTLMAALKKTP